MLFDTAKPISYHSRTPQIFGEIFTSFRLLVSYNGYFNFSPKLFGESVELSENLILYTANIAVIFTVICHWLSGRGFGPPPYKFFYHRKTYFFSLWKKRFWISFASLLNPRSSHRLSKLIRNYVSQSKNISFSVVKTLVRGGRGAEPPPPPHNHMRILLLLPDMFFVW